MSRPLSPPAASRCAGSCGHIRRTTLLAILQERARELGAELRFQHEVSELPEADLVVGADGVNSLARGTADFGTRIRRYPTRFAWFGADFALDAFTFAFRETEHGLFQAHAYPFDAAMSTLGFDGSVATVPRTFTRLCSGRGRGGGRFFS